MALEHIFEDPDRDITITRARYAELLRAEQDAERLKKLIYQKAKKHDFITNTEINLINEIYNGTEEREENNNG